MIFVFFFFVQSPVKDPNFSVKELHNHELPQLGGTENSTRSGLHFHTEVPYSILYPEESLSEFP